MSQKKKKDHYRTKAILSSCSHTAPEPYLLAVITSFLVSFRGRVFPFGLQEKGCSGWKGKGEISYENTQTHTLLVIPAQSRLEQEDLKFETNLDYIIKPCLKTKFNKVTKTKHHESTSPQRHEKPSCFYESCPFVSKLLSHLDHSGLTVCGALHMHQKSSSCSIKRAGHGLMNSSH